MRRNRPSWRWIVGVNLALALCVAAAPVPALPGPLRMLAAGLLVLVLPGMSWLGLWRRPLTPARLALAVTGVSSLSTLGALALTAVGPEVPSRGLAVAWTVLVVNGGLVLAGRPGPLDPTCRWRLLAAVAALGFALSSACALHLVPLLEDHDMELRGSAWGLATVYQPYYLTNRELYVQAAHPLLFHFHIAESLLLSGEIEATRPSYESARRAQAAEARGAAIPWEAWWQADYEAMLANPALVGTRAPSCLLSALALALLLQAALSLIGSAGAALAVVSLYLSFPETLVRSCYAGYYPVTVFVTLVLALLYGERDGAKPPPGRTAWLLAGGLLAAVANHKTVVLVLALLAVAAVGALAAALSERRPADLWRRIDPGVLALGAGFFLGTMLWWSYAWLVHAPSFIEDHLRKHIAHRILLNDFRLGDSPERYAPGMLEVWAEFNAHTGYLFVPVALAGVGLLLARWLGRLLAGTEGLAAATRASGGPGSRGSLAPALAVWFVTGAVLYTVTDWRQTKHLMNQLAPMVAAAVVLVWTLLRDGRRSGRDQPGSAPRRAPGAARALGVAALLALLLAFGLNLRADLRLLRDFRSMTISGASAIDGW